MNGLTASVLCDRCRTCLYCSNRTSPNGSSSNCSFSSDSYATHHQVCTCSAHHCVDTQSQNCALSKRPSRHRRGSTRSSHESICCHRDHPSRRQSTCHDSQTCPMNCSSFLGCVGFVDGPGDDTPVSFLSCSVARLGQDTPVSHISGVGLGDDAPVSPTVCRKLH